MAETRNTIRWDSAGADKVKRDFAEITAANEQATSTIQRTGAAASSAGSQVDKLGRSSREYAVHAKVASTSTDALNVGLAALGRYITAGTLLAMGAQALRAADQYRVLQGRIAQATRETGDFASVSKELFDVSQRTGTALETNVALFQRMAVGAREFGAGNADILKVTEAVQKLGIIGGASQASIAAGTLQLAQGMAAGVLRAEEFNSVIENLPEVAQAIAKGLGVSVGELRKMVLEGEVLSRDVFVALLETAGEVEQRFSAVPTSLAQATQRLSDSFGQAAGESKSLIETIDLITDGIETLGQSMDGFFRPMNEFIRTTVKEFRAIYGVMQDIMSLVGVDVPNLGSAAAGGNPHYSGPRVLVSDRTGLGKGGVGPGSPSETDLAKAAKATEDWQTRVADGWRDLYDRVGQASADFNEKIAADARKAGDEEQKAFQDRKDAIAGMMADLQLETELIGLSNQERERRVGLMKLEAQGASPDEIGRFNAGIDAKVAKEAAQQAADDVEAIWDRARETERVGWSDFWYDVFKDGKFRFGGLVDSFRSAWARGMADMLANSQQGLFGPLIGGLAGLFGGSMSGGTGAAGTRNVFGGLNWFGGSSSMSMGSLADLGDGSGLRVANGGSASSGGFGDMMSSGAGGIAASLGSLLSSINGRGGKITSTLGGLGGQIGSMFGPIGSLIGGGAGIGLGSTIQGLKNGSLNWLGAVTEIFPSFLPFGEILAPLSLLGINPFGLFGHTPLSAASFTGGGLKASDGFGGLKPKVSEGLVKSLFKQLEGFADAIDGGLDEDVFGGIIGQRGKKFFYQPQDSKLGSAGKKRFGAERFKTAEEAIAAAVDAALKNGIIEGLTDADKRLLEAADSVQEGMQDVISAHDFKKELGFQFQGLTDPLGEQLARLEDWYGDQLKLAEKYEADKTQLEAVYAARRRDLIESHNEQLYGGLKDFLTAITAGAASPLSPTSRLNLASTRYGDLASKARAGDRDAIAALQGAAQDYLGAGRDVFASSSGYFQIYDTVVSDLSKITGAANPLGSSMAASNQNLAAVNDNTKYQITQNERAFNQRARLIDQNEELLNLWRPVAASLGRGVSMPTQNGIVQVGSVPGW